MARYGFMLPKEHIRKTDIDTPALLIDLDVVEANIALMAKSCDEMGVNLRPHFKAHKSSVLALAQIAAGAIGMTCAKVGEAEVLAEAGVEEILIANEIVTPNKIQRVAQLAKKTQIIVAVDDENNLRAISKIAVENGVDIGVLVEIDVGFNRCGVRSIPLAVTLARLATTLPGIIFRGIMGYEGHCNKYGDFQKRKEEVGLANNILSLFKKALAEENVFTEIVSAGGTAMFNITPCNDDITEIQAGAYILMGTKWSSMENIPFRQAETILTTVVSTPLPDTIIIDAGYKAFSTEAGNPIVKGCAGLEIVRISEEHTTLKITSNDVHVSIGDTLEMIPANCCTTTNLYDYFCGMRQGRLERIIPIDARGRCD